MVLGEVSAQDPSAKDLSDSLGDTIIWGFVQEARILAGSILYMVLLCVEGVGGGRVWGSSC